MKRILFLSILILFITVSVVGCNNQKEDYKLQEQCGKRSEEWFKKEYDGMSCSYKNHYNKKLNKCFILVSCITGVGHNENLFDVNENDKVGGYSYFKEGMGFCSMLGKVCKSKSEWDSLVKPYME